MKQLKKLLWCILLICSVQVQATSWNVSEWTLEDSSGKARVSVENGIMDILSPDGLTLWFNERITGNYEISYRIRVVMNNGKYDRLSDMNCFWGPMTLKIRIISLPSPNSGRGFSATTTT